MLVFSSRERPPDGWIGISTRCIGAVDHRVAISTPGVGHARRTELIRISGRSVHMMRMALFAEEGYRLLQEIIIDGTMG